MPMAKRLEIQSEQQGKWERSQSIDSRAARHTDFAKEGKGDALCWQTQIRKPSDEMHAS